MSNLFRLSLLGLMAVSATWAEVRFYNFTIHAGEDAPDGYSRPVYLINGQQPAPLIEIDEGDTLQVFVRNDLPVETTVHWHGILQRGTPHMDGVPGVTQNPIPPGGNFTYRFDLEDEYGFYWYHSHFRAYYNDAIRGPLVIRPNPSRMRPYEALASNDAELKSLRAAELNAVPVLLADWYHRTSDVVLAEYNRTGAFPLCVDSLLANGRGRVQCLPQDVLDCGTSLCGGADGSGSMSKSSTKMSMPSSAAMSMPSSAAMSMPSSAVMSMPSSAVMSMPSSAVMSAGMDSMQGTSSDATTPHAMSMAMPSSDMSTGQPMHQRKRQMTDMSNMMDMSGMVTSLGPRGCTPPAMFKPGYNASDLTPETCNATTTSLLQITAPADSGWLVLHLVNAGATSKLTASLDSHSMFVYAADGLFVQMQEVKVLPIGIGERYSVMIKLDQNPGQYYLRFAATPLGDMQQVVESAAVVQYQRNVSPTSSMVGMAGSSSPETSNAQLPSSLDADSDGIYMLLNSSAKSDVSTLNTSRLAPFATIPPPRYSNASYNFQISQTGDVSWVVDRYGYAESQVPILYGNGSDGWNANTTLHMPFNSSIDLIMTIAPDSMDKMGHPMHLHGHKFWILGSGTGDFPYSTVEEASSSMALNVDNPPYRDTVELPPSGWAVIRYVSDNPGAWLFHCHIQWHLTSGMALVLVEGEDRLPALLESAGVSVAQSPAGDSGSSPASTSSSHRLEARSTALVTGFGALTVALMSLSLSV